MKKFFAIMFAFVMIITTLVGCGENRSNLYDPEYKGIMLGNVFFAENADGVSQENVIQDKKEYFNSVIEMCTEIVDLDNDYIHTLKEKVIEYFEVEYGIDVSQKINGLETKLMSVEDDIILGFYYSGTNTVYVNKILYEDRIDEFPFTWCHEVIHLLGLDYDNDMYWALYETVTEAVNIRMLGWMGYPCGGSSYMYASMIGQQLILANPELVTRSIMDETFHIEDNINEVLADAEYSLAKVPEDTSIAYQFNAYLNCMISQNELYWSGSEIFDFFIQEIAVAYCRTFNLDEEEIEILKTLWLFEDFDKVTIKSEGGTTSLVKR